MNFKTEFRIFMNKKTTFAERFIENFIDGKVDSITFKKENIIMIEELKKKRDEYANRLAELQNEDLEPIIRERMEQARCEIEKSVYYEHNSDIEKATLKVNVIEEMIAAEEEAAVEEVTEENTEVNV